MRLNILLLIMIICGINGELLAEEDEALSWDIQYTYGNLHFLPSILANSPLQIDSKDPYSDLWLIGHLQFNENLSYAISVQATNMPHQLINTMYSRPDYPISTGRVQKSVVHYTSGNFNLSAGREDFLTAGYRPEVLRYPIAADGFRWEYQWHDWRFQHVHQVLPAETANGVVFRRSLSYHHLSKQFGNLNFKLGEFLILTGETLGFDLKRFNPLLPFIINSHDSEADIYPGFNGDSDNALIKFGLDWKKPQRIYALNFYVDEFQIDPEDREVANDALLLVLSAQNQLEFMNRILDLKYGASFSNPNFGQHPGPFTTTTIGFYPMFEYTPGMKHLYWLDGEYEVSKNLVIFAGAHTVDWVQITQLAPSQMNLISELEQLEDNTGSEFTLGLNYKFSKLPLGIGILTWFGDESGFHLSMNFGSSLLLH